MVEGKGGREEMSTQLLWLPERGSSNGTWHSRPLLHAAGGGGSEWALTARRKDGREEGRAAEEERLQECTGNQRGGIGNMGILVNGAGEVAYCRERDIKSEASVRVNMERRNYGGMLVWEMERDCMWHR